jgi:uncharacterized protein YlxW (UPF0749 family)
VVPLVALVAGVLFATSARTANGTELRSNGRDQLAQLVGDRSDEAHRSENEAARLRAQVEADTRAKGSSDARVADANARADRLRESGGLSAMSGPALTVTLDDAPRSADGTLPVGATADDVVVHQQDVQAVVNALWAGGAEAMTIMGQRVVATTAVRCVGNTLLLQERVYSPPFVVTAIGDRVRLRQALDASADVQLFRRAGADFGLGYRVVDEPGDVVVPAYQGTVALDHAQVPAR